MAKEPHLLKSGGPAHVFTTEDARKGAEATNRIKAERARTAREVLADTVGPRLEEMAAVLADKVIADADQATFRTLFEQAYGKAPQAIELYGADDKPPVQVTHEKGLTLADVANLHAQLKPGPSSSDS